MKVSGYINDCHTIWGNSYKVMTDEGDYHVCPVGSSCVFVGLIEREKATSFGYQIRYYKGMEVSFGKIFGRKVICTADEAVKDIMKFMMTQPSKFENLFNKTAKPGTKKGIYPQVSIKKILKESGPA